MIDDLQIVEIKMELSNIKRLVEQIVIHDNWITIKEAVEYSNTSESTLDRAIRKGILKCSRQTGKRLFRRSAIDRWLENG